jgi:hypothetical protein
MISDRLYWGLFSVGFGLLVYSIAPPPMPLTTKVSAAAAVIYGIYAVATVLGVPTFKDVVERWKAD